MSRRAAIIDDGGNGPAIVPVIVPTIDAGAGGGDAGGTPNPEPEVINGFETVEPGAGRTSAGGGTSGKRRGRPPGAAAGQKAKGKSDIGGLEQILYSVHMMAAAITATPELVLDEGESKALADAAAKVAAHYDHTIDPKTMAWVNLAMVAGGLYGTRIFAIRQRYKRTGNPKVVEMRQAPPPQPTPAAPPVKASTAAAVHTPADLFGVAGNGLISPDFSAHGD